MPDGQTDRARRVLPQRDAGRHRSTSRPTSSRSSCPRGRSSPTSAPSPTWPTATRPRTWSSSTPRRTWRRSRSTSSSSTPPCSTAEGRPVEGLEQKDFTVTEDGVKQEIARFERVTDLPIHAAVTIDISASMEKNLDKARTAALQFLQGTIQPKDRAAVVTFNDHPNLTVKFTNDLPALAGGLAGPQGRARHGALRQHHLHPLLLHRRQGAAGHAAAHRRQGRGEPLHLRGRPRIRPPRRRHHLRHRPRRRRRASASWRRSPRRPAAAPSSSRASTSWPASTRRSRASCARST